MPRPAHVKPGLQAERTLLSWERSAMGFLVGGALILLKRHGPLELGRTALVLTAGALVLLVLGLAYRRSRRIRDVRVVAGRSVVASPHLEVHVIGGATIVFALAVSVAFALYVL